MSTTAHSNETSQAEKLVHEPVFLAKVGGRFHRFPNEGAFPENATERYTDVTLESMSKEDVGKLYGDVIGTNAKNFRTKEIAVSSLAYQAAKLPMFDPTKPVPTPIPPRSSHTAPLEQGSQGATSSTTAAEKPAPRKTTSTYTLMRPENSEAVLASLAPQARALVSVMVNLVEERGSATFPEAEFIERLKQPEVVELLKTKQDPARILQYYKGKLISVGFIRVV